MSKARIIESIKSLDLETTAALLEARPSLLTVVNRQGRNLLHLACSASSAKLEAFDPALLRWLVTHGASPDITDHRGVSPRLKASRKRDKRFLAALE